MPKIPQCDALRAGFAHRCSLYAHNPHLIYAVHPDGLDSDRCLDFRLDPNTEIEEQLIFDYNSDNQLFLRDRQLCLPHSSNLMPRKI